MRQCDVPYTALIANGQHAAAFLHAVLWRDMLLDTPSRTTAQLSQILGVGDKRVGQLFTLLERYGLVVTTMHGRKRSVAVSAVPNEILVGELAKALGDPADPFATVTGHLLRIHPHLPMPAWPGLQPGIGRGYVRPADAVADLPAYVTLTDQTVYSPATVVRHADVSDAPVLVLKQPKPVRKTTVPQSSFAFRYWSRERLAEDVQYYQDVCLVLACWAESFGVPVPLMGDTYRLVRQQLHENGMSVDALLVAVQNFASDPWWREKRPGLATFFDKPARVLEFANKAPVHDRFARNWKPEAGETSYEF